MRFKKFRGTLGLAGRRKTSEVKFFEVRDAGTFMPVLGLRPIPKSAADLYLCHRAGFVGARVVCLIPLERKDWTWDPHKWPSRTLSVAHEYIQRFWSTLPSGSVIDVEFILGITKTPKQSESVEWPL